jgi:hypothetical protein
MTFTYKLSRRLAILRGGLLLALGLSVLVACQDDQADSLVGPPSDSIARLSPTRVKVTPDSLTLERNQTAHFAAYGLNRKGDSTSISVVWSATGGTITPDGKFTSTSTGRYRIFAKTGGKRGAVDSAAVNVVMPQPNLVAVLVSPHTATLAPGDSATFKAVGELSDSSTVPIGLTWSATGGQVDPSGTYNAGTSAGVFRVIASNTSATLADTATITIAAAPAPLPTRLVLSPATVSLTTGATQRFAATGLTDSGDTVPVPLTFTATGGSVDSLGLYTAGSSAGTFRVVATSSEPRLADTSTVTVTTPSVPTDTVHAGWHVGPNGGSGTAGTLASPWSLAYALTGAAGRIRPGDTVWVHRGLYAAYEWTQPKVSGTASAPVIFRNYPGERATISSEGMFTIDGSDTWWWGLEFTFAGWTTRTSPESGSHPTAIPGPLSTVYVTGPRTKIINCLVHDTGDGVAIWDQAAGSELYGSLVWYTGWQGPDRGHGHAVYTQNSGAQQVYRDNLLWDSYDIGVQAYGSGSVTIRNYLFEGNGIWGHGTLATSGSTSQAQFGGDGDGQDFIIRQNVVYDLLNVAGAARFGYNTGVQYYRYTITDNWFIGGGPTMRIWNLNQSSFTNNVTWNPRCSDGCRMDMLGNRSGWAWSGNTHYGNAGAIDWSYNNSNKTWTDWKAATGLGGGDTYAASPSGQKILVRPNLYEKGRANVVVLSLSGAGTASVDLTGILQAGQAYEVRNAQNFFGTPVVTGTYTGGAVTLPLSGLTKAALTGSAPRAPMSTGTLFNAFVVIGK